MGISLDHVTDPDDARWHLADATREIIRELTSSTASGEEFEQARDLVRRAAAILAARGHGRRYGGAEASLSDRASSGEFLNDSPFLGRLNPLAPPIVVRIEREPSTDVPTAAAAADPTGGVRSDGWHDALVVGTVTFGGAYEGPPGCVHGGFIAGSFDEILGVTQSLSGQPGMTAQLDISYRSPTPLRREVHFRGRIERIDGRKIHALATLHHGDVLCAEARGLFISMKPEVFERLMRDRAQAED